MTNKVKTLKEEGRATSKTRGYKEESLDVMVDKMKRARGRIGKPIPSVHFRSLSGRVTRPLPSYFPVTKREDDRGFKEELLLGAGGDGFGTIINLPPLSKEEWEAGDLANQTFTEPDSTEGKR